jgi:hypothetical protein
MAVINGRESGVGSQRRKHHSWLVVSGTWLTGRDSSLGDRARGDRSSRNKVLVTVHLN